MSMQNTEFILVLLLMNYCIGFHMNNCKPTFASPCMFNSRHYILYFTKDLSGPDQVAQLVGASSQRARVAGLIPSQETYKRQPVKA